MNLEHSVRHYGIDESHMIDSVLALPEHMEEAWRLAEPFTRAMSAWTSTLIVCGMGGSAIGGALLRDLIAREAVGSIYLERDYSVPGFADANTPVICVSYSGNTEEVLSAFENALSRGCPVGVITAGGMLEEEARRAGAPLLKVPGGMPPRAAIGYLFTPLLRLASSRGLFKLEEDEFRAVLRKTAKLLGKCSLEADLAGNSALQLAKRLYGKIPLIYSGNGLLQGASYRWKCQFNENSKSMAFRNVFPELGHNEVMAWDCPDKLRQDIFLILLTDRDDHPRVQRRMDLTFSLLGPLAGGAIKIESVGGEECRGRLARLLSILVLGDLTSVYLAVEYGQDPTPIGKIEEIKTLLKTEAE
ncbi:MAG: bifunctional phosphoglucose/phosphomannose isomerase [Candidatus Krumholzibacteriota bacterium]|nr:bifunctional phosphoglucose/phosphomannose isomerase [Candidatus Krumholzibacteriota bacterium]